MDVDKKIKKYYSPTSIIVLGRVICFINLINLILKNFKTNYKK